MRFKYQSRTKLFVLSLLAFITNAVFSESAPVPVFDLNSATVVDMSHPFNKETVYWPTAPSTFRLKRLHHGHTERGYFYSANVFCTPEHGGTHFDAPIHFAKGAWDSEQIPVEQFIGPAVVIEVRDKAATERDYRLSVSDIRGWESEHGRIPAKAIVLLNTGWANRWPDRKRYLGSVQKGNASNLHFPSYGKASAEFLITQRRVKALGVDTASIDYGPSKDFIVHRIAGAANVIGLENVAKLNKLPPSGAWIIALPMKITGGSGGPTRIVGLVPEK